MKFDKLSFQCKKRKNKAVTELTGMAISLNEEQLGHLRLWLTGFVSGLANSPAAKLKLSNVNEYAKRKLQKRVLTVLTRSNIGKIQKDSKPC